MLNRFGMNLKTVGTFCAFLICFLYFSTTEAQTSREPSGKSGPTMLVPDRAMKVAVAHLIRPCVCDYSLVASLKRCEVKCVRLGGSHLRFGVDSRVVNPKFDTSLFFKVGIGNNERLQVVDGTEGEVKVTLSFAIDSDKKVELNEQVDHLEADDQRFTSGVFYLNDPEYEASVKVSIKAEIIAQSAIVELTGVEIDGDVDITLTGKGSIPGQVARVDLTGKTLQEGTREIEEMIRVAHQMIVEEASDGLVEDTAEALVFALKVHTSINEVIEKTVKDIDTTRVKFVAAAKKQATSWAIDAVGCVVNGALFPLPQLPAWCPEP
jgi:hypothetical protein